MKKLLFIVIILSLLQAFAIPAYTGSASLSVDPPPLIHIVRVGEVFYSPLDKLGRPTGVIANLTPETIGTNRAAMQSIIPPGFIQANYDFIPALNLYHRCHLLGDQLGGSEIEENLVTGTQYLNIVGMLPIENRVAEHINSTNETVIYQAVPAYVMDNLLCAGVYIRAYSPSRSLDISVYCFNVQPGIRIDYRTGYSRLAEIQAFIDQQDGGGLKVTYYVNTNTKRFHRVDCPSVSEALPKNMTAYYGDRDSLIEAKYKPCGRCNP